jgi:hypothetical protein
VGYAVVAVEGVGIENEELDVEYDEAEGDDA